MTAAEEVDVPAFVPAPLAALYRAIVLNPGEDTPRLMYADAAEELGLDADRAALVRAHYRLREIGPAPRAFHAQRVTPLPGGLCEFAAGAETAPRPGDRILLYAAAGPPPPGSAHAAVLAAQPDGTGLVRVVARSGVAAYPEAEVKALQFEAAAALGRHPEWLPPNTEARLGFASRFVYPNRDVALPAELDALVRAHPIAAARLGAVGHPYPNDKRIALLLRWFPRVRRWEWPGFSYDLDKEPALRG